MYISCKGGECLDLLQTAAVLIGERDLRTLGDGGFVKDLSSYFRNAEEFDSENNDSKNKQLITEALNILNVIEVALNEEWNKCLSKVTQKDLMKAMKPEISVNAETTPKKSINRRSDPSSKTVPTAGAAAPEDLNEEDKEIFFHKLSPLLSENKYQCIICKKLYENFTSFKKHLQSFHETSIDIGEEVKCTCYLPRKSDEICNIN